MSGFREQTPLTSTESAEPGGGGVSAFSPRNYEWPQWRVSCTCLDEDGRPYSVREGCSDCATDRAAVHTALGHNPTLQPPNRGS